MEDHAKEMVSSWVAKLEKVFEGPVPASAEWNTPVEIQRVLSLVAGNDVHVFLPDNGGQDLAAVQLAKNGVLEWSPEVGGLGRYVYTCAPARLTFAKLHGADSEAHFILESGRLDIADPEQDSRYQHQVEEILQVGEGKYLPRRLWDQGLDLSGNPLPDDTRVVVRQLAPARFAIFSKGSHYNSVNIPQFDAYSAFHNDETKFLKIVDELSCHWKEI